MKKLIIILVLSTCQKVNATNWISYYVYFETEYLQGPWSRAFVLENSEGKYLVPELYEDLLGSSDQVVVGRIISRLRDKKPESYNWTYKISTQKDTVTLSSNKQFWEVETVKNELVTSLIFNGFRAVILRSNDKEERLTIEDIKVPYFDLIEWKNPDTIQAPVVQAIVKPSPPQVENRNEIVTETKVEGNNNFLWLLISGILNILMLGIFIARKMGTTKTKPPDSV